VLAWWGRIRSQDRRSVCPHRVLSPALNDSQLYSLSLLPLWWQKEWRGADQLWRACQEQRSDKAFFAQEIELSTEMWLEVEQGKDEKKGFPRVQDGISTRGALKGEEASVFEGQIGGLWMKKWLGCMTARQASWNDTGNCWFSRCSGNNSTKQESGFIYLHLNQHH
jgi:hypothetical protein